ncbi:hypothetical protein A1O3_08135 [Capronia epimyces CBS 606.96]|uniref:Putative zinc-finger domain-containing protein n=1 Tax=Capronia epimyces CBS 606.96 TaxID=1182542 RepID=W9XRB3_9EURO|nr:uncharacterized protein A1O3_08135 [Capronia epimyces CBS 606.96]EXJ79850.1 hypothetical protein A1O3_08135 [Capronia epimyces CBS 606.96]
MAHPYSSTPSYGGTTSYTPQQPYYSPFPPNGLLQQQIHTPPGQPQQPPQLPGSYQPSPSTNIPRFDANSQIRPPAPPFPHFPPPAAFNPDLFKQFASAGLPPPPPPSFPPMPVNTTGYPQFPPLVSSAAPSPYTHHNTSGTQAVGVGYSPNEQVPQHLSDPFGGPQQGQTETRESRDSRHGPQSYGAQNAGQNGASYPAHHIKTVDIDLDKGLPSFGSKSDLDLLFATAQGQVEQATADSRMGNASSTAGASADGGNVSPYDPSRPATIQDRASAGFGASTSVSGATLSKSVMRTYDNKSPTELRQLAKGALLSLVPHSILYKDLVREGVNPQVLRNLYGELGIKVELEETQQAREVAQTSSLPSTTDVPATSEQPSVDALVQGVGLDNIQATTHVPSPQASSKALGLSVLQKNEKPPLPVASDATNAPLAPSPNLERKDRIAQLLAAKTGRPSPATTNAIPPANDESSVSMEAGKPVPSTNPPSTSSPATGTAQAQNLPKARAQTEVVKQRMEQLRREAQAKAETTTLDGAAATATIAGGKSIADSVTISSQAIATYNAPSGESTFIIPGLFMTASGDLGLEETADRSAVRDSGDDTEMGGTLNNEYTAQDTVVPAEPRSSVSPTISLKRPLTFDANESGLQPQAKKIDTGEHSHGNGALGDAGDDNPSEGEILEGSEHDAMQMEAEATPQTPAEGVGRPGRYSDASMLQKPETSLPSLTALQEDPASASDQAGSGLLYRAKQSEIEAMRRKIAELEERNRLKRSRSQIEPSVSSIPQGGQQSSSPPAPQPPAQAAPLASSVQRPSLGARTISKLTPAQLAQRAAALKADLLRQRAQRQQVLQEGLPDLNAEVQKTEVRLERARSDLARTQADVENYQTALERSTRRVNELLGEIAELEKQLQEGRSGQKQYADELQQIKLDKLAEAEQVRENPAEESEPVPQTQPTTITSTASPPGPNSSNDDSGATLSHPNREVLSKTTLEDSTSAQPAIDAETATTSNGQAPDAPSKFLVTTAAHSQEAVGKEEALQAAARVDTLQTDAMEISPEPEYLPEIHQTTVPASDSRRPSNDTSMDMDDDSEGSVSMSDSGSEAEEEDDDDDDDDEEEEDYEPADADTSQPTQQSDEDSDEYDPEEAPVQDLTPTTGVNEEYELSEDQLDTEAGRSEDMAHEPVDQGQVVSATSADTKLDDSESGLELAEADSSPKTQDVPDGESPGATSILDGREPSTVHFVPYKTPLSTLKTYRFHPDYNDTVKTGYRSLTYSNQIDPSRPLCPTELSGEPCRDPKCEEQHFSQLGLSDDKILIQMSSAADIKDKTLRDQFIVGLKQVIAGLKARDVKEFEEVANALSAYRRNFFAEKEEAP